MFLISKKEPEITQESKSKSVSVPESVRIEKTNSVNVSRIKSRSSSDIPFDKMQFTMRREYEKAKEEAELIRQLRTVKNRNYF